MLTLRWSLQGDLGGSTGFLGDVKYVEGIAACGGRSARESVPAAALIG